jgi:hypothetical protein
VSAPVISLGTLIQSPVMDSIAAEIASSGLARRRVAAILGRALRSDAPGDLERVAFLGEALMTAVSRKGPFERRYIASIVLEAAGYEIATWPGKAQIATW